MLLNQDIGMMDYIGSKNYGTIKDGQEAVGNRTRVKVVKNKLAQPFKEVEFDIIYGKEISRIGELLDIGVKEGAIDKSGAWYSFRGERIGQGRKNVKEFLKDNPDVRDVISIKLKNALGLSEAEKESA
jgi:recombination protein RecA